MTPPTKPIRCFECRGTGAAVPDCWMCSGRMTVKWRRAVALGWKKEWLHDIEDDGYCTCPREECRGDYCEVCRGDGTTMPGALEREVTRVLVYGLKQRLPPLVERVTYRNGYSTVLDRERLLSREAASQCDERGWGHRLNSMLGHEFYLTPEGKAEALRRYPGWSSDLSGTSLQHWLAWMGEDDDPYAWAREPRDVDPAAAGRWADDGGAQA